MDRIDIDLSQIDSPYNQLEDGEYKLTVFDVAYQESKSSGRPMVVATYTHPDPEDPNGSIFIKDYVLLDNRRGLFRFRQMAEAAGADISEFKGDPQQWDLTPLLNVEVDAVVTLEESDEFGPQNRVKALLVKINK